MLGCVRAPEQFDLHVKRGHRGRLVDVTSLGMSVIDWHWRMEGWEELWRSCAERQEKQHLLEQFYKNSFWGFFYLNTSQMRGTGLMSIFEQTHPN